MEEETKNQFFRRLFSELENKKIGYCILRNWEFITNKKYYDEIDILIDYKKLRILKKIIKNFPHCFETNHVVDTTHQYLVLAVGKNFKVELDFQIRGIGFMGSYFLYSKKILGNTKKYKFFKIQRKEYYFLMLLIHGVIYKGKIKLFEKYEKEFFKLSKKVDERIILKNLTEMFNKRYAVKILRLIKEKKLTKLFKLRKKLVLEYLFYHQNQVKDIFLSIIIRFFNKTKMRAFLDAINPIKFAPLVSFVGLDGSGKTTLSNYCNKELKKINLKVKLISAGVFSSLKIPSWIKKRGEYSKRVGSLSQNKKRGFEIMARIITQIPLHLKILLYRKKNYLVLTDRYVYDLITLYGVEKKFILKYFPRPSKIFYLDVSLKSILKRNKELNKRAIIKIKNNYEINKKELNLIRIKNENLDEAKKEILDHIYNLVKIIK